MRAPYLDEVDETDEGLADPEMPNPEETRKPIPIHKYSTATPKAPEQADPVPQAAAPSTDSGFDFGRFFAGLGGGQSAVANLDSMRAGKVNQGLAQQREARDAADYRDQQEDRTRQKAMAMARIDPASNESRQAQSDYAEELKSAASLPGIPDGFKKSLLDMAAASTTMSAARIDSVRPQVTGRLNMMLKAADIQAKQGLAAQNVDLKKQQIDATIGNQNTDNRLAAATLGETSRHHRAVEEAAANKPVKVKLPGETTLKDHRMRAVSLSEIDEILKLLPKVRYLGVGGETANQVAGMLPGGLDPRNPEEKKAAALLGRLRAPERNKLYGAALSKYDIKDANSFIANLGNNRETLEANLNTLRDSLNEQNDMLKEQYPTMSGDPLPAHDKKTGAENIDPQRAERTVKAKAVLANPSKYSPKQVELAKKWLETTSQN